MTDQEFAAWLDNPAAIRCILVEVDVKAGGSVVTRYLSNRGYVTGPSDTPANTLYSPLVVGGIKYTQSLALAGDVSLSFGDIELNNIDGSLDSWLDDYWSNRQLKIFVGDVSWLRSDFRQIFNGITTGIDTRSRTRINIKISDKLQRLNTPVSETKIGGTSSLADNLIPICFGECHNITPVLVDAALYEYQVHNGPIESIIEVRDNGVPVPITPFLATGKFRLTSPPVGTLTCSVQGDKNTTYVNDVAGIVQRLVTGFGSATQRFTTADLDTAKLYAFATANTSPIGLYMKDRTNVLEACNKVASSVGARLVMSQAGLMSIVKLTLPQGSAGTTVTSADMVERSLEVSQLVPVVASVKLGYCKNWTVQSNLETGIPAAHIALYAEEWLTVTRADTAAAANYNLYTEPTMIETLLLTASDATTEALRRLNMFNVQRRVYKYTGYYSLIQEELGNSQTIRHSRFGLSSGKTGQIISITKDWISPKVDFEVLI